MVNLIQLQNQLKSLGDEELQGEAATPSGTAPPFLVLTEINRRKTMRDAYSAQQSRRQPSTTVAEDLLMAPIGTPGRQTGAGAPRDSSGIGIAAALPGAPITPPAAPDAGGIPAFATGGLVGGGGEDDLMARIMARRKASLDDVDTQRDRLLGRSLMAAGGAMMTNGSANFMTNLGAGITGGITAWDEGAQIIDSRESEAIDDMMGVNDAKRAERLAAMDEQFRRDDMKLRSSQFDAEINRPTADQQNYETYAGLDEVGQADFLLVNGRGTAATGGVTIKAAMDAYANVSEDVRKEVLEAYKYDLVELTGPERVAVEAKIEQEIKDKAKVRFESMYSEYAPLLPQLTQSTAGGTATAGTGDMDWSTYF